MTEPIWIYEELAIRAHRRAITRYGGVHGLRSEDLFRSAIARPKQIYAYSSSADLITLAAAYTVG